MDSKVVNIERSSYRVRILAGAQSFLIPEDFLHRRAAGPQWFAGFGDEGLLLGTQATSAEVVIFGSGVAGEPGFSIEVISQSPLYLSVLMQDIAQLLGQHGVDTERPFACRIEAEQAEVEAGTGHEKGKATGIESFSAEKVRIFGFSFREPEHIPSDEPHLRHLCETIAAFPCGGGIAGWFFMQRGNTVVQPEPETMLKGVSLHVWTPGRTGDAADFGI